MHPLLRGAVAGCCAIAATASAQPGHDHAMPKRTLLTARAASEEVVPRPAPPSEATATGAFTIGADGRKIDYRITWDGLATGAATQVDVHNFARGGRGSAIATLCGGNAPRCPEAKGATIEGSWTIDPAMLRELAVERTYVDVHTAGTRDGELRGQILAVPWMIHSEQYVGRLRDGTATVYVTPFPRGTQLQLDLTVAGLPAGPTVIEFRSGGRVTGRLPVDGGAVRRRGGTVSALLPPAARLAPLGEGAVAALRSGRTTIVVVVNGRTAASGPLAAVK